VGAQVPSVSGNTFSETPFTTLSGGGPMAIDANGNVWVSGNGKLAEITSYGTQAPGSPFTGVVGGGSQMAIDKQGNIWLANNSSVVEFDSTGAFVSPAAGFVNTGISNIVAVALDSSNNVDIVANNGRVSQLTNPAGNPIVSGVGGGTSSNSLAGSRNLSYLAADGQGDMWETGYDSLCKIPPYPGTLNGYQWEQELQASNFCSNYNAETSAPGVVLPGGVALDGRGPLTKGTQVRVIRISQV